VKPNLIFRPTDQFGKLCPDPKSQFLLFDRVVNIDKGITVPLGLRGTVVGIYKGKYLLDKWFTNVKILRGSICEFQRKLNGACKPFRCK